MIDKIQAYYEGEMSAEEKQKFQEELKTDSKLAEEVELYKNMKTAISQEAMKETLEAIHNETFGTPSGTRNSLSKGNMKWLLILLPILIGGLAFLIMWESGVDPETQEEKIEPTQLYAQAMPSLDGMPVTLSSTGDNNFREGMIAYRRKDFSKAFTYFNELYASANLNDTVAIYLANTFIALNEYEQADGVLDFMLERNSDVYKNEALYYSVKANLLSGQIEKAVERAKQLAENSEEYKEEMNRIIEAFE